MNNYLTHRPTKEKMAYFVWKSVKFLLKSMC